MLTLALPEPGLPQQTNDLFVFSLAEIPVMRPHRIERRG